MSTTSEVKHDYVIVTATAVDGQRDVTRLVQLLSISFFPGQQQTAREANCSTQRVQLACALQRGKRSVMPYFSLMMFVSQKAVTPGCACTMAIAY